MSDVVPFLTAIRGPVRGLAAALPAVETAPAASPWSPQPTAPASLPKVDVDAIREQARRDGLAEGLRETAALRARLVELVTALERAKDSVVPPTSERIADAAACIIEAWFGGADRKDVLRPIVQGWLASAEGTSAVARVHPDDEAALRECIADAAISIVVDPQLRPGEIRIRGGALELVSAFESRLADLRTAITAALEAP